MRTAVLLATLAACSPAAKSRDVDDSEARKLLLDRNWIERMPDTERDRFHVYRFVPAMGGGVFQDRTIFKGTFELFRFGARVYARYQPQFLEEFVEDNMNADTSSAGYVESPEMVMAAEEARQLLEGETGQGSS